ncbi:MAG: hypothetical protein ACXU8O_04235 [Asticcacaulis sp.]
MIRYVAIAAGTALLAASISACTFTGAGYRDPAPRDRRHADASEGASSSNASYSSQLSVINRRACHAKGEKDCG